MISTVSLLNELLSMPMTLRCQVLCFTILYLFITEFPTRLCFFLNKPWNCLWIVFRNFERYIFPAESWLTLNLWNKAIFLSYLIYQSKNSEGVRAWRRCYPHTGNNGLSWALHRGLAHPGFRSVCTIKCWLPCGRSWRVHLTCDKNGSKGPMLIWVEEKCQLGSWPIFVIIQGTVHPMIHVGEATEDLLEVTVGFFIFQLQERRLVDKISIPKQISYY